MAKNYLDKTGLTYLWEKISAIFVKKDGSKVLSTNDYISSTSTNPVQNKVINTELGKKINTADLIAITSEEIDAIVEG